MRAVNTYRPAIWSAQHAVHVADTWFLPWAFAPRVGLTTRFSFRRFHYIGPSSHDGLMQRAAPIITRLGVNASCEYVSTSDLECSARGTRGGHVVLKWVFAPRVGLTTRFSFRRFHYIGPSSHDGSTQRAAPVTSRLRVNDSCKHTSTSDLKCLARGARRRTRGVAMGLHVSRRIDDKFFFGFYRLHHNESTSHGGSTQRANFTAIVFVQ